MANLCAVPESETIRPIYKKREGEALGSFMFDKYPTLCGYTGCTTLIFRGRWCALHGEQLIDMLAHQNKRDVKESGQQ